MNGDLCGLRIGLLTASASRLGGGVFEAVAQQAAMIRHLRGEPVVLSLADEHSAEDRARFGAAQMHHIPVSGPGRFGYAPGLVERLLAADLDLLHLHGIWMYPSRAAAVWARRTGRPYCISPHGMLDRWITARGRAQKAIARIGYERSSWRAATALHALTDCEAADIARETGRTDTLVIPNPGPTAAPSRSRIAAPRVLYLGRIHPKKNIGSLIEAWAELGNLVEATGARLCIAGWGEPAHVAQLKERLAQAPGSIEFVGAVYGEDKSALLREARMLVLPSFSEGQPIVVLEAWAEGTPTLMTENSNLPEGFAAGAAIKSGHSPVALATGLRAFLTMPQPQWLAMSQAASGLAAGPFSADVVADRWAAAYHDLRARHSNRDDAA